MTALTPESISTLVHTFYDDVRADPELAPVFNRAIGADWAPHLSRMVDFWSNVMLGIKGFQGNVFGKHMVLEGVEPQHFERWLALFSDAVDRLAMEAEAADEFRIVARRIAHSLQYGFFGKVMVA
jgi:hemoglobin